MTNEDFNFEKALHRAESIAASIEEGKIGLEESIAQFEEGMALIKKCRGVLDQAELRIQQLEGSGANDVTVKDGRNLEQTSES